MHGPQFSDQNHAKDFALLRQTFEPESQHISSCSTLYNHVSNLPIRSPKLRSIFPLLEHLFADPGSGGGAEEEPDGETMGIDGDDSCW